MTLNIFPEDFATLFKQKMLFQDKVLIFSAADVKSHSLPVFVSLGRH